MRPIPFLSVLLALFPLGAPSPGHAGAGETEAPQPTQVIYEGTLELEGHYARPGATRRFHSRQRFRLDGRGNVLLDWATWPEGDSMGAPESYLVVGARAFHRPDPGARWRELSGMSGDQARFQARAGIPQGFRGCHELTPVRDRDARGKRSEATVRRAHPRLGDVTDRVRYDVAWGNPGPMWMEVHERDHQWKLEATPASVQCVAESVLAIPAAYDPAPEHPDSLRGAPVLREVAEGVWSVDLEDVDSRSLVVEFQDHLALIEVAVSSANGERIVDALKRKWPSKPVRYVLFSHHHPHYAGGLRALIAESATVVTTPGNEAYVRRIAAYRFGIAPDRLARTPRPVHVIPFPARIELADSTNRLVAWNIGKRSDHTDEFVLFWLPRQRVLFEAEQGWVTVNGTLRASRRAATLLAILKEENMDADRVVQSWPMRGEPGVVPLGDLQALVAKRK